MKKVFLFTFILFATVSSVMAQTNFDSFLGDWKLIEIVGSKPIKTEVKLSLSLNSDEIILERSKKDASSNYIQFSKEIFYSNGKLSSGNQTLSPGSWQQNRISYAKNNQLKFERKIESINESNGWVSINSEYWTLSKDGKTLTIESVYKRENGFNMNRNSNNYSTLGGYRTILKYSKL